MTYLDDIFRAGGRLAVKPGYEERPGQIAMAEAVDRAITRKRHLLVEAGTDRGVVVCLDRRLIDKPYGRIFLASIPRVRVAYNLGEVGRFLEKEVRQ